MSNDPWCIAAEAALREAGGASVVDRLRAEDQALPPLPIISVFGAYDAGKSTLLKRLLVEAGTGVPAWLTVSARRETFEVNAVEAFGCLLRDTPGIAAGSTSHDGLALEAVTGSDVVMLVMPPQLLTGERDKILSILSGKAFRPGGLSLANALFVVIAKLDEGTVDPVDDPSAYNEYLLRKRREWKTLLEANEVCVTEAPVFTVSADPFQRVGNAASPVRDDYDDEYRRWDGVSDLVLALADLPDRLRSLRLTGRVRRLCWHLWAALDAVDDSLVQINASKIEAEQAKKRFAIFARKQEALMGMARDELDRVVAEELLTVARRGSVEPKDIADQLESCITRWENNQAAALDKLIGESEVELETRDRARKIISVASEAVGSSRLSLPFDREIAHGAINHVRSLFDTFISFHLDGKTLAAAKTMNIGGLRSLHTADLIITLTPQLVDLCSLLYGVYEKKREAEKTDARRQEARRALQNMGEQISNETWTHFCTRAEAFSDWVTANMAQVDEMLEALVAEERRLKSAAQQLRIVLEDDAIPAARS